MNVSHASKQGFGKDCTINISNIHKVMKLTELSRAYKMPFRLTFIHLKKGFDFVETDAVMATPDDQGVPTQCFRIVRELYSNFTTQSRHSSTTSPSMLREGSDKAIPARQSYLAPFSSIALMMMTL